MNPIQFRRPFHAPAGPHKRQGVLRQSMPSGPRLSAYHIPHPSCPPGRAGRACICPPAATPLHPSRPAAHHTHHSVHPLSARRAPSRAESRRSAIVRDRHPAPAGLRKGQGRAAITRPCRPAFKCSPHPPPVAPAKPRKPQRLVAPGRFSGCLRHAFSFHRRKSKAARPEAWLWARRMPAATMPASLVSQTGRRPMNRTPPPVFETAGAAGRGKDGGVAAQG